MQLRRVPVALTTGWGGLAHTGAPVTAMALASPPRPGGMAPPSFMADLAPLAMRNPDDADSGLFSHAVERASRGFDRVRHTLQNLSSVGPKPHAPQQRAGDRHVAKEMHAVVHLQRADGSWDLTRDLASAIGQDLSVLQAAGQHVAGTGHDSRPWATALAIAWLHVHASADEAEWQFLVRKARTWLAGVWGAADSESWIEAARDVVIGQLVVGSS